MMVLAILALVAAGVAPLWPPSVEAASVTSGPHVTNVTDKSFVVSWVTSTPSEGHVRYGTESGVYPNRADDERGADYVGSTHFVRIGGLLGANTRYYYSVVSGDSTLDSPNTYNLITGPTASASSAFLVSGFVQKTDGSSAEDALVYVFPQRQGNQNVPSRMVWLAALTDSEGHFSVDVSVARAATSAERTVGVAFGALAAVDHVRYKAIGGVRDGGGANETNWQQQDLTQAILDAGAVEVDPLALPYAEQLTPSPSATPTATYTPTRSPTPTTSAATPTTTATPPPTPTLTIPPAPTTVRPTRPPEATTTAATPAAPLALSPAVPPTIKPPSSPGASTPAPAGSPPASPAATQTADSAPGATRSRTPSATARPTRAITTSTPTPPLAGSATRGGPDEGEPLPDGLKALLLVASTLLLGGFALASIGVVQSLRRRAA